MAKPKDESGRGRRKQGEYEHKQQPVNIILLTRENEKDKATVLTRYWALY